VESLQILSAILHGNFALESPEGSGYVRFS
jgi:hypothetical protein